MDARWPFFSLDVELTNLCEQACLMCPRDRITRPQGLMPARTWQAILALALEVPSRVALSGMGNPLRHPEWPEMLRTLTTAGIHGGLVIPAASLNDEVMSTIDEIVPGFLEISFPSLEPEIFARLCPGGDLPTSLPRVMTLAGRLRKKTAITIIGLRTTLNPAEDELFARTWPPLGLSYRLAPCHSRGGNLSPTLPTAIPHPGASCGLFGVHSFITWEGDLLACCHDLSGETRMGNVTTAPWRALAETKRLLSEARKLPFPLCLGCDEPRKGYPVPLERSFPETASACRRFFQWWKPRDSS